MGAENSHQQRVDVEGREVFEGDVRGAVTTNASGGTVTTEAKSTKRRSNVNTNNSVASGVAPNLPSHKATTVVIASPTTSELSRPPSPPLSICSDLPYVSYTDRPIGESPKIRSKPQSASSATRAVMRRSHPATTGTKPKRPQSSTSSHNIVIVKPGSTRDIDNDIEPELERLRSIPQFLPVLRNSITSATFTRDPEVLERLQSQHLLNICTRMQTHLNLCATQVAKEQSQLVERTKVVSNSITTLFASFVDMQKTYADYAEQFARIRVISQQLGRCNTLLHENMASLEAINNFLPIEERLEPFVWRTDDQKWRSVEGDDDGGGDGGQLKRLK